MMAKRVKASCTYRDSSYNDVEILGSTQGSGAPVISQFTVLSRPTKIAASVFSAKRHRYNYRDDIDEEDGH